MIILKIKLTFLESIRIGITLFEAGESIIITYLGGGDLLRCEYEGVVYEIPSSVVRQEFL